jgi:hypothetical protein
MTMTNDESLFQPYGIDHSAQKIVLSNRDAQDVLNESHKMRMSVSYGLERFWGEHLRLKRDRKTEQKGAYWQQVWKAVAIILEESGIILPQEDCQNSQDIERAVNQIWSLSLADQQVALMVLTQFCDSLVWWTQRYKKSRERR